MRELVEAFHGVAEREENVGKAGAEQKRVRAKGRGCHFGGFAGCKKMASTK